MMNALAIGIGITAIATVFMGASVMVASAFAVLALIVMTGTEIKGRK